MLAAKAEVGQFEEAVQVIQQAMRLVDKDRNPTFFKALDRRMALYRDKQPYRDVVSANSDDALPRTIQKAVPLD